MSNATMQTWLDRFFASYYRHRPVNATFIGEHAHDHLLPDYSDSGVEAALADAETLLREATALDAGAFDPFERMDLRLAQGYLRMQQWEFASTHFQRGNPSLYTGEALFGLIGLLLTDFAPAAERTEAAIARLRTVGRLLEQGQANIAAAPPAWTERALRECAGARALLGGGINLAAAELGVNPAPLRAAADDALAAFARYEGWLRDSLLQAPSNLIAAGGEAFEMFL
ncbi:MAG: DUF885 family protein, partial [Caldilineaceae bacterium]